MKKNAPYIILTVVLLISMSFVSCKKEDKFMPVITINGDTIKNIYLNEVYIDAGAKATDDKDGDISKSIFVKNEVNVDKVGSYKVIYSVSDKAGNVAPTKTRIVNVKNASDKYLGNYFSKNYTYYPVNDSVFYNTSLIMDSTLNNHLFFTVFGDNIPKEVFFVVTNGQVEMPYQKIIFSSDSVEYTYQGYGSINDTLIKLNYLKGKSGFIYSCKAEFKKVITN
jgi:hypothetical protein